jgi:hypothetical protein
MSTKIDMGGVRERDLKDLCITKELALDMRG